MDESRRDDDDVFKDTDPYSDYQYRHFTFRNNEYKQPP